MAKKETRAELIKAVIERKQALWGQGDRPFSVTRSARNVSKPPGATEKVPNAVLRWAAYDATDTELYVNAARQSSQFAFLYYK